MRTLSFEETMQVSGGVVQTNDDLGSGFGMPGASSIMDQAYLLGAGCTTEATGNSMTLTCPANGGNSGATSGGRLRGHITQHGSLIGCGLGVWRPATVAVAGVAGPVGWAAFAATAAGTVVSCGQVIIDQN